MFFPKQIFAILLLAGLTLIAPQSFAEEQKQSEREAMYYAYAELSHNIKGGWVSPNWHPDGQSFWYIDPDTGETQTFIADLATNSGKIESGPGEPPSARPRPKPGEIMSPDRIWALGARGLNITLRSVSGGEVIPLAPDDHKDVEWATDGLEGFWAIWSPDSSKAVVNRRNFLKTPKFPYIIGTPDNATVEWVPKFQAGKSRGVNEIFVLDTQTKSFKRIETESDEEQLLFLLGWRPDGSEFLFARVSVDFKKMEVVAVNPLTNESRIVFSENKDTFHHFPRGYPPKVTFVLNGDEFLFFSDQDGWRHIYRYDLARGQSQKVTTGEMVVLDILGVDEEVGWVYFIAHSNPKRPYDVHLNRARLDGSEVEQITKADGIHLINPSPTLEVFVDTYWGLDWVPTSNVILADGTLLATLSTGRLDVEAGFIYVPPEEFTVKAADGVTDIHGILYKPWDFDPAQQYPVIEIITGRPDIEINTIIRWHSLGGEALAQLGFIVIALDGRGTPGRSRTFHEASFGRLGGIEINDHVAALKELGAERPYMDLERVGVVGFSFGGYYAIRAMLMAPDIYKVGVAIAPLDIRMDTVVPFMGLPQDNPEGYAFSSNISQASNLEGKLLIIHGLDDRSVSPLYTFDLIRSFIKAGKPYDLLLIPDAGHDFPNLRPEAAGTYAGKAIRRYFQEHLKP